MNAKRVLTVVAITGLLALMALILTGCPFGVHLTAPLAAFTATPTIGSVPLTVNFTDQSTGDVSSWLWDFGDGGTSTEQNPTHVYNASGIYTVSLTVDYWGLSPNTETKELYIRAADRLVDDDKVECPTAGYTSIQAAVDAASAGDLVLVCAGTYTEQVYITKSLTLQGIAASPKPVIKAPAAGSRTTYTIPESGRTFDPIVFADGGTGTINVTVDNFEIDGNDDPGSNNFVGILFRNTKPGKISNNDLHSLIGTQETHGILMYGASTDCTVSGNTIKEFSRNGITANVDAKATITGNTIEGRGYVPSGNWAQNAIQIGWNASGSVIGNTISKIGWIYPGSGTSWAATGVLLYQASGSTSVNNNKLTDVMVGIYFYECSGEAIGNEVRMTGADSLDYTMGICADPGAEEIFVSPFDAPAEGKVIAAAPTPLTFSLKDNVVIGDKSADGWGIGIYNDSSGAYSVTATATGNSVKDWDYGFEIWTGASSTISATINKNNIQGNNYGVYNWMITTLVDATNNWWGAASGPNDSSGTNEVPPCTTEPTTEKNTDGTGDKVTDNVDYCPWATTPF